VKNSKELFAMDVAKLDHAVQVVQKGKDEWSQLPVEQKISLLLQVRRNTGRLAERWVQLAAEAKKIPSDSPWVGEEWASGPWAFLAGINALLDTLQAVANGKTPHISKVRTRDNGQVVAQVFPANNFDRVILNGLIAEVWMQPEVTRENLSGSMGRFYKQKNVAGKVALILGAGNIAAIPLLDLLHKLFTEGQVVLLKMNTVNDYLGPVFEQILEPFIKANYVQLVYGGARVGHYLTYHEGVDEIHLTGSLRTHDAIVFGSGKEGEERKKKNSPVLKKRITSELGGITPAIILPGPWTKADIRFQAERLATMKFHNSGFNCIASQILVMPQHWEQSPLLLGAIRHQMETLPPRIAYYPGADKRQQAVIKRHPSAETFGSGDTSRTLVTNLDPNDGDEYCYNHEIFAPVYAQVNLPGETAAQYLKNAVEFANEKLKGTLGATIIAHPKTIKELGPALEEAIADLKYGGIGLNVWDGGVFLLGQAAWGSWPGHPLNDAQSGRGFVHNSFMFDKPQKTVARGSFYPFPRAWLHGDFHTSPRPAWFVTNKTAHVTIRRVTMLAADPGWKHIPGIIASALKGNF
jgi:aldehyde dehydrogenase (NAD(P)+)